MEKTCFKCKKIKSIHQFYKHKDMSDGHVNKCKDCSKIDGRNNYAKKIDEKRKYDSYRQKYSFKRIFNHRYMNIKHRCQGKTSNGKYKDIYFCSKKEFIDWCYKEENIKCFTQLWLNWMNSGFESRLIPSIDRIDNNIGYAPENMQWLSHSQNAKKSDGKKMKVVKRNKKGHILSSERN